jgi:hypothetical protein
VHCNSWGSEQYEQHGESEALWKSIGDDDDVTVKPMIMLQNTGDDDDVAAATWTAG